MSRLTRTLLHKSAETLADFVDRVGNSPETFLESDGIDARTCTCLPALPKPRRQTTNVSYTGPKSEALARVLIRKLVSRAGLSQAGARVSRDIRRFR